MAPKIKKGGGKKEEKFQDHGADDTVASYIVPSEQLLLGSAHLENGEQGSSVQSIVAENARNVPSGGQDLHIAAEDDREGEQVDEFIVKDRRRPP